MHAVETTHLNRWRRRSEREEEEEGEIVPDENYPRTKIVHFDEQITDALERRMETIAEEDAPLVGSIRFERSSGKYDRRFGGVQHAVVSEGDTALIGQTRRIDRVIARIVDCQQCAVHVRKLILIVDSTRIFVVPDLTERTLLNGGIVFCTTDVRIEDIFVEVDGERSWIESKRLMKSTRDHRCSVFE